MPNDIKEFNLFDYNIIIKIFKEFKIILPEITKFDTTSEKNYYKYSLYEKNPRKMISIRILKNGKNYYITRTRCKIILLKFYKDEADFIWTKIEEIYSKLINLK